MISNRAGMSLVWNTLRRIKKIEQVYINLSINLMANNTCILNLKLFTVSAYSHASINLAWRLKWLYVLYVQKIGVQYQMVKTRDMKTLNLMGREFSKSMTACGSSISTRTKTRFVLMNSSKLQRFPPTCMLFKQVHIPFMKILILCTLHKEYLSDNHWSLTWDMNSFSVSPKQLLIFIRKPLVKDTHSLRLIMLCVQITNTAPWKTLGASRIVTISCVLPNTCLSHS